MTEHRFITLMFIGLAVVLAVTLPAGGATAEEPSPPVSVDHTFVGTSENSDHAVEVTINIAPTDETGAIDNTVVTLRSSDSAFIGQSSISTSETAGGDQVIMRQQENPLAFEVSKLQPGETATISYRVYPKAVLPSGDTLATVDIETQFVETRRVVSETVAITPEVANSQAGYGVEPRFPPLLSAGIGAITAAVVTGIIAVLYVRRKQNALRGILGAAKSQATGARTKQSIDDALTRLGGSEGSVETEVQTGLTDGADNDDLDLSLDD